eukprot:scaffold776_cov347-Pavlova_lutheri.AAC.93
MRMSGPTCWTPDTSTGSACVISTYPRSPHGVGAPEPPIILGATKAIVLWITPDAMAGAANVPPHSQRTRRKPLSTQ